MTWKRAVACIKKGDTKQVARALTQVLGRKRIRIIGFMRPCGLVFEKRDCTYRQVGKAIMKGIGND